MIKLIDALRLCDKVTFNGYEMINFWPDNSSPLVKISIDDDDQGVDFTITVDGSKVIAPDETDVCQIEDLAGDLWDVELMVYVPLSREYIPEELLT